jgi:hypothetical protein
MGRVNCNRDLAPHLHRGADLHVLRESGLPHDHAEAPCEVGCGFILVDPRSTAQRTDGLRRALTEYGIAP